ncbi:PAS domain S-box [Rubellimicrobium thermophilum DSM 16684]|uniref:histidine kinase n=1 Tax=Rubellimicrobium thermophilum DSM 16684 TaxID=1123069 RepID=S9QT01_9RHOB|nr:ATP-binding protein [Rubellimicrobium thermophilum]EPX82788.1 PAS domain S-box [Rubellimicrobium thermophilum DSM 16684]
MRRAHSVRQHLYLHALGLMLPILLLVGILLWQTNAAERARVESEALATAMRLASAVERELTALHAALDVLSLSERLRSGDFEEFHQQAVSLRERQGLTVFLRRPDGSQILDARRPWGSPLPDLSLPVDAGLLATGRSAVSGLYVSPVTQAPAFAVVMPVQVAGGQGGTYLLGLSLDADRLAPLFEEAGVPERWTAAIVDADGTIMARNRDAARFVGTQATADLIAATTGLRGTWPGTTADGAQVSGAYARIPAADWRAAIGVRAGEMAAPLRRSLGLMLALAAGLIGLSLLLAWVFERRIVGPIQAIGRQAEALGRGEPVAPLESGLAEADQVSRALGVATASLHERNQLLDVLNRLGREMAGELDPSRLIDRVTEAATLLTGAAYGAFFERLPGAGPDGGDLWRLGALTGAERAAFERFGLPRATRLFRPTFAAEGPVRSDDVPADPRYGSHGGLPAGHLPVRSYLAVPVVSVGAGTLGALLFGHPEPARFGEREERLAEGLAGQAAVALDNARLFEAARREIDSRRAAEAALARAGMQAEARAAERAAILGQLAEGVIVTDAEGRIVFVNEAAARLHGTADLDVRPEDYAGRYHLLTMDGRPYPSHDLPLARAVLHGETVLDARWRIRRPDGTEVVAVGSARPVFAPDGTRVGSVLTLRDDTLREAAEREQRRLNEALAEQAAELAESNEELQRYAYIVSHDLRSPLVNVMGFTSELQTLRDELLAAGARPGDDPLRARTIAEFDEALGFIKTATAKMEGLIAAILRLSREGRRLLRPEPLAMTPLMQGIADSMRHQTDAAGAVIEIAPDLPDLEADRLAVEQVFGNLLDNAVKYLDPSRPGLIRVSGEERGLRVAYRVVDNGRGIAPRDHARVFELFRRAGPQDRPGEGIGLAHVRTLVRAMGGRVELDSEPGHGTTFTVILPRRPLQRSARAAAE